MKRNKIIRYCVENPKKLFLFDGVGALLSAFLLGVVLMHYQNIFGIPKSILLILAVLPLMFFLYDVLCYVFTKNRISTFLMGIALINVLYCILSLILSIYSFADITYLGWMYIMGEIFLVLILVYIEFVTAKSIV